MRQDNDKKNVEDLVQKTIIEWIGQVWLMLTKSYGNMINTSCYNMETMLAVNWNRCKVITIFNKLEKGERRKKYIFICYLLKAYCCITWTLVSSSKCVFALSIFSFRLLLLHRLLCHLFRFLLLLLLRFHLFLLHISIFLFIFPLPIFLSLSPLARSLCIHIHIRVSSHVSCTIRMSIKLIVKSWTAQRISFFRSLSFYLCLLSYRKLAKHKLNILFGNIGLNSFWNFLFLDFGLGKFHNLTNVRQLEFYGFEISYNFPPFQAFWKWQW